MKEDKGTEGIQICPVIHNLGKQDLPLFVGLDAPVFEWSQACVIMSLLSSPSVLDQIQ